MSPNGCLQKGREEMEEEEGGLIGLRGLIGIIGVFRGRLLPLFFHLGPVQGPARVVEVRVVMALCI